MQRLSTYKIRIKTVALTISALVVTLWSAALPTSALEMGGPSDCDSNAVIKCGAHSTTELKRAYQNDPYVQDVYNGFGISDQDVHNIGSSSVSGKVTNRGNVYVDGKNKPVATGAMTAGRTNMSGSSRSNTGSSTFYRRPTSVSMQQPSLPAYVVMDSNGQFKYAVMASCGNPVTATPVTPAPKPSTTTPQKQPTPQATPAPAQNQQQQQQQQQTQQVTINNNVTQAPATPSSAVDTSVPANTNTTPANVSTAQSQEQNQAQQQAQQQQQQQTQSQTVPTTQPTTTTETAPVTTTTTTQPQAQTTALPNTGAAGVIVLFLLSSAAGFYWYRKYLTHLMAE